MKRNRIALRNTVALKTTVALATSLSLAVGAVVVPQATAQDNRPSQSKPADVDYWKDTEFYPAKPNPCPRRTCQLARKSAARRNPLRLDVYYG